MKLCVSSAKAAATAEAGLGGDAMPGLASDRVGRGDVGYMAVMCRGSVVPPAGVHPRQSPNTRSLSAFAGLRAARCVPRLAVQAVRDSCLAELPLWIAMLAC